MKRVLYALAFGIVTFVVGAVILMILGTNVLNNPFSYQSLIVVAAGVIVAVYAYWRILRSV